MTDLRADSLTHEDLQRAAGVEKMARAMADDWLGPGAWGGKFYPMSERERNTWLAHATAALAAWERHCDEIKKAPE